MVLGGSLFGKHNLVILNTITKFSSARLARYQTKVRNHFLIYPWSMSKRKINDASAEWETKRRCRDDIRTALRKLSEDLAELKQKKSELVDELKDIDLQAELPQCFEQLITDRVLTRLILKTRRTIECGGSNYINITVGVCGKIRDYEMLFGNYNVYEDVYGETVEDSVFFCPCNEDDEAPGSLQEAWQNMFEDCDKPMTPSLFSCAIASLALYCFCMHDKTIREYFPNATLDDIDYPSKPEH